MYIRVHLCGFGDAIFLVNFAASTKGRILIIIFIAPIFIENYYKEEPF